MNNCPYLQIFKSCKRILKGFKRVAPVYFRCRFFVHGLQSQLYPHKCFFIKLCKQRKRLVRNAVRPCGYGKPHNLVVIESVIIFFSEIRYRSIGICMVLKIRYIRGFRPFVRQQVYLLPDGSRKVSGAVRSAESTASCAFGAVSVGAGEAALKRKLYNFFTEILLEICAY